MNIKEAKELIKKKNQLLLDIHSYLSLIADLDAEVTDLENIKNYLCRYAYLIRHDILDDEIIERKAKK